MTISLRTLDEKPLEDSEKERPMGPLRDYPVQQCVFTLSGIGRDGMRRAGLIHILTLVPVTVSTGVGHGQRSDSGIQSLWTMSAGPYDLSSNNLKATGATESGLRYNWGLLSFSGGFTAPQQ